MHLKTAAPHNFKLFDQKMCFVTSLFGSTCAQTSQTLVHASEHLFYFTCGTHHTTAVAHTTGCLLAQALLFVQFINFIFLF